MKIFPTELAVEDDEGFLPEKDLFLRAPVAANLTNLITRVEDPLVVAVDAPWGSGKTVFLKMWAGELRKLGIPVLYFDAFASDHADDAFLALTSEVVALAQQHRLEQKPVDVFVERAVDASKSLMSSVGRLAGKAVIRATTAGTLTAADIGDELSSSVANDAAGLADQQLRSVLLGAQQRRSAIEAFRNELATLPALIAESARMKDVEAGGESDKVADTSSYPLVFIVDDLDRCTPPFALDLLERMKHVFSVPNVHFVFGVHLEQLEQTVRAAYGSDIDAKTYLQKFIHFTIPLAAVPDKNDETASKTYIEHLFKTLIAGTNQENAAQAANSFLSMYAEHSGVSLRTIERIYSSLAACFATIPENRMAIGPLLAGLAVLRTLHPSLFQAAKRGTLRYKDVESIFGLEGVDSDIRYGGKAFLAGWWRFACDPEAEEELIGKFGRDLFRYSIFDREELLPTLANRVLEVYD